MAVEEHEAEEKDRQDPDKRFSSMDTISLRYIDVFNRLVVIVRVHYIYCT